MKNKVLEDIKKYAAQRLQQEYGYCGIADTAEMSMLNSGADGENIVIHIQSGSSDLPEVKQPQQESVAVFELQKTGWEIICDMDWIQTLPFGTLLFTGSSSQHDQYDLSAVIRLTHEKTKQIIERDGHKITGFVMTKDDGEKCIVDMSAVRWFFKGEDFSRMMHPDNAPRAEVQMQQLPVAHRMSRKTAYGDWTHDERYWVDGAPSAELLADVEKRSESWRIECAYAAPFQAAQPVWNLSKDGLPPVGAEVIGGHFYKDTWLEGEPEVFLWGKCTVSADQHPDFKGGKRWHTFGPSHNQITHWCWPPKGPVVAPVDGAQSARRGEL
jgi:hypothetical protein